MGFDVRSDRKHRAAPMGAYVEMMRVVSSGDWCRSAEAVADLAPAAYRPGVSTWALTKRRTDLGNGFPLRCLQRLSAPDAATRPCRWSTTGSPEVRPPRPLVLGQPPRFSCAQEDRDRTVSRRSEPSSRTALNGEQPYPWDLLQPQDAMSRHRGAKPCRRCGLLGKISLLSPEYLLSVERRPSHVGPPDH